MIFRLWSMLKLWKPKNNQTLLIPFFHVFCILHLDGFNLFYARLLDHEDGASALGLLQGLDEWKSQMSYLDRKQAWALFAAGWWKHRQAAFLVALRGIFLKSAKMKTMKTSCMPYKCRRRRLVALLELLYNCLARFWYILTTSSLLYHTRKSDGESIQRAFPRCLYVAFIQEPTQSLRFLAFSGTVVLLCSCWNSLAVPKFQKVRFSHLLATDHELEAQARQAVQVLFTASSAMSNVMSSNLQHPLPRRHKHSQAIYEGWSALGNRSLNPSCVHGRIKQISPFNHAVFWNTIICSASGADFLCESFSGAFVDKSALELRRFGNALIKFVKLHWLVLVLLHETPWKQHANTIPSNCSQVLCGALPVGYLKAVKANEWATFARVDA